MITAITVAVLAIEPLRDAVGEAVSGDTESLREQLRDLGGLGVAILFALCVLHAVVWYPAEIVDAAAGFVYGFWPALGLVMAGWLANAIVTWEIGRRAARPLLYRFLGERRFTAAERMIEAGGVTLLLGARLIPILPFSLTGYVAGAARVPFGRFIWTTLAGYLPLTALFVYLGSRLDELSPTDPAVLAAVAGLLVLLVVGHRLAPALMSRGSFRGSVPGSPGRPDDVAEPVLGVPDLLAQDVGEERAEDEAADRR